MIDFVYDIINDCEADDNYDVTRDDDDKFAHLSAEFEISDTSHSYEVHGSSCVVNDRGVELKSLEVDGVELAPDNKHKLFNENEMGFSLSSVIDMMEQKFIDGG